MTNIEALVTLTCGLPEIELQSFLEEVAGHCHREKLTHVVKAAFGSTYSEDIEYLEQQNEDLEKDVETLRDEITDLNHEIEDLEEKIEELKEEKS